MTCAARRCGRARHALLDDGELLLEGRIVDPLIQAAALQRVVHVTRPVGRQDDERRVRGAHRAELGNRDLEFRQQLEQIALELLVGAIDLVDQQHRRLAAGRIDGLQQRPLDQERIAVQFLPRLRAIDAAGGIEDAQLEDLARVVPFVDRVRDVQSFVALQADHVGIERRGNRGGERGLADAGFALEEQRAPQLQRQEQRHGQRAIGDVVLLRESLLQIGDGSRPGHSAQSISPSVILA